MSGTALLALSWTLVSFAGCNSLFGIDIPPVKATNGWGGEDATEAGSGGGGATSGGAQGGAGLGASGREDAGHGNRAGSGGGHAGKGGTPSGGGSAGTTPAEAGHGGEGPPAKGRSCGTEGALACVRHAAPTRLLCQGGVWIKYDYCGQGQYCDSRSGACAEPIDGCDIDAKAGTKSCRGPYGDDILTCGPDLVTAESEHCIFGCNREGNGCIEQHDTLLQVEKPPGVTTVNAYWPPSPSGDTRIPVCIDNPEAEVSDLAEIIGYVRNEVESTWGRYGGVAFTGWGACGVGATGVKLRFVGQDTPCSEELGGIDRIGYPGANAALELKLCLRFHDTDVFKRERTPSEALMRVVARHEFGHALGFDDRVNGFHVSEFMAPAIDVDQLQNYPFARQYVWKLQQVYGRKPSSALVATNGRCLTRGESDELTFDVCDASDAQQFRFQNGELKHDSSGTCLRAEAGDGALSFVSCTPSGSLPDVEQAFHAAGVQIRSYGGLCLETPSYPSKLDDPAEVQVCTEGDPDQLWDVDWVDDGSRLRLSQPQTSSCLGRPDTDPPSLASAACGAEPDRFESMNAGQLSINGRCAVPLGGDELDSPPDTGQVQLTTCSLHPRMVWSLSGRIVGGTDQMLGRSEDAGSAQLVASPLSGEQSESQIFDYYWRAEP